MVSRLRVGRASSPLLAPGVGEDGLALEAASAQAGEHEDGIFWIGLAPLRDPPLSPRRSARRSARRRACGHIGDRKQLLLLDNLEHVIEQPLGLARSSPPARTSGCSSPAASFCVSAARSSTKSPPLAESAAVELFCRPLPQVAASKEIGGALRAPRQPAARARAGRRTHGLVHTGQLLDRVSQRLDLLKGGRDTDPRQQTLRAAIEWSYDLLDPQEQRCSAP